VTSPEVTWHPSEIDRSQRWSASRLSGATIWLTGLSGSGKSTIARRAERLLIDSGRACYVLDGDNLRHGLNADLGFDAASREENVRRVGEVARLLADAGVVAISTLISPYQSGRERVRAQHDEAGLRFVEVYVATPLELCEQRDPKGLYRRARAGELTGFTGVDDPYEPPEHPELILGPDVSVADAAASVARLV
jgi:adenylyl-sulfate kinase